MLDRYSKVVLTIIAGALSVIAWNALTPDRARADADCGASATNPCYVAIVTKNDAGRIRASNQLPEIDVSPFDAQGNWR